MALDFLNRCKFSATSSGTADFTVSAASTLFLTPAQAGATNQNTYRYIAESTGNAEWEVGTGTYNSTATTSTTNVSVSRSSGNVTFSSNSNTIVAFTAAPTVRFGGPLSEDMHEDILYDTTVSGGTTNVTVSVPYSCFANYESFRIEAMSVQLSSASDDTPMHWGFWTQPTGGGSDNIDITGVTATTETKFRGSVRVLLQEQSTSEHHIAVEYQIYGSNTVGNSTGKFYDQVDNQDYGGGVSVVFTFRDSLNATVPTASGRFVAYGKRLP